MWFLGSSAGFPPIAAVLRVSLVPPYTPRKTLFERLLACPGGIISEGVLPIALTREDSISSWALSCCS